MRTTLERAWKMLVLPEQVRQDVAQRMAASGDLARRKAASPTFLYRRPVHQDEIRGASTPSGISPACIIRSVSRAPMPSIHMRRQRIPVRSPERPCTTHLQPARAIKPSRIAWPLPAYPPERPLQGRDASMRMLDAGFRVEHSEESRRAWETEF